MSATPPRWQQVKTIFQAARAREKSERADFVLRSCGGDPVLQAEVQSLLDADERADGFLDVPTSPRTPRSGDDSPLTGRRFGAYEIIRRIGEGGMGEVYLARRADDEYAKQVAIKLVRIRAGSDMIVSRFRHERQILAGLEHANIARLLDGGTTEEGWPFFVLEYVEGVPIDTYCDTHHLSIPDRLRLFLDVCSAVQHAHEHRIVHRDLKPTNILVNSEGVAKLLDFGIAKVLMGEETRAIDATAATVRMMTPEYASPEQVRGDPTSTATDIYALGVVLYRLLTGRAPYRVTTGRPHELMQAICDQQPPRPSTAVEKSTAGPARRLTADLDAIALKALRKEPELRYETAAAFADDIRRYLEGMPVTARRGRASYRAGKFVRRNRWGVAASIVGALIAAIGSVTYVRMTDPRGASDPPARSVAILPFHAIGIVPDDEYLAVGMADALITRLSNMRQLAVRPTSAILKYGSATDVIAAARELRVDAVLDGRIQRQGDRIRVTTQLIGVDDAAPLWAATFDEPFTDLFAVQDAISQRVAESLLRRLTADDRGRLTAGATTDPEAFQLYLRGRFQWNKRTEEGFAKAIELFNQAIMRDPQYAAAHAGLADTYLNLFDYGLMPAAEATAKATAAATRALELDDGLAEAHNSLAHIHLHEWRWADAEKEFERAIDLSPSYPSAYHWYALYLTSVGRVKEAVAAIERAQELDPVSLRISADVGQAYNAARLPDRAIEQERKVLELDPNFRVAYWIRGMAYEQKGMLGEAVDQFREALKRSPGNPNYLAALGHALALQGDVREARRTIEALEKSRKPGDGSTFFLALVYTGLGETDAALDWLEAACDERSGSVRYLKVEPRLDPVRSHPRFQALLGRVGLI
jgi:TolB-like protein/tetratricopeptide (TPR) repeat protein/tRNA A-37 threonylcarbamoyl transferase component Bud32